MKKSLVFILAAVLMLTLVMTACSGGSTDNETTGSTLQSESEPASEAAAPAKEEAQEPEDLTDAIEILAEYTLSDSIGWYTRHFMVIKNNASTTVDVSTSSLAYDADGNLLGAAEASFDALGSGCTSVIYEAFETEGVVDHYETTTSAAASSYFRSVIQDLSYTETIVSNGAVYQVTNNGSVPAEFVEGYALFFRGGELIGYESTYFTDNDSEIKPGSTISNQLTAYENFDTIEFYLTGRSSGSGSSSGATANVTVDQNAVQIVAEYTLSDSIGWYTRHFVVITNVSDTTIDVATSSLAYDAAGNLIGAADATFDALGAGCTSVIYEAFEVESVIDHFDTTINATASRYYESVIQDLTYTESVLSNGAVYQVTNNGSAAAEFVEGYALFFKGDQLVGYESTYFTDDDSEIKPGATITKQLTAYDSFDSVQFYLTGRR